jgi:hypothetical protein
MGKIKVPFLSELCLAVTEEVRQLTEKERTEVFPKRTNQSEEKSRVDRVVLPTHTGLTGILKGSEKEVNYQEPRKAFVDTSQNKETGLGNQESPEGNGKSVARLSEDVVLPPRSESLGYARTTFPNSTELILEPTGVGRDGILVANILTRVLDGEIPIRLLNITMESVIIPQGTVVGILSARNLTSESIFPIGGVSKGNQLTPQRMTRRDFAALFDLDQVPMKHTQALLDVLNEYEDVFQIPGRPLGCTSMIQHHVDTGNAPPIAQRPYRLPERHRAALKENIDSLLEEGVIRPSVSPWASPIVLVNKPDGSLRLCCDYRKLNRVTTLDPYPLPLITETLDALGGAKYFSSLDLASGYWQVELDDESIPKSAFVVPNGKYEFSRMPFGMVGAPSTFQRLMDSLLSGLLFEVCLVYLDDVIVFSRSFEEHLDRLRIVFRKLREANLRLKPNKCHFLRTSLKYLGHTVSPTGVQPDSEKLRAVERYPCPTSVREIRAFLGLVGFYRRFIPHFAETAKPLTQLLRKDMDFRWGAEQTKAFQELKSSLLREPILKFPDFTKPFVVATDASNVAIGSVLCQTHNGVEFPISYNSRQLSDSEKKYSTIQKELLAVVNAIKTYRCYLYGRKFTLITDHAPLRWLMNLKDPSSQLARWSILLQNFNYDVIHRPGRRHSNVDALSRILVSDQEEKKTEEDKLLNISFVGAMNTVPSPEEVPDVFEPTYDKQRIEKEQRLDPAWKLIIEYLETGELGELNATPKDEFIIVENLLFRRAEFPSGRVVDQLVVPNTMIRHIMELNHEPPLAGHLGVKKTLGRIQTQFYWPGMSRDIQRFVRTCHQCQEKKTPIGRKVAPLQILPGVQRPFELVSMDVLGPLPITLEGNKFILMFTDYMTRWVEAVPIPDQKAETVAKVFITTIITRHGVPQKLLTDKGTNFLSKMMSAIYKYLGVDKIQTTAYHPSTNGVIERFNKTLTQMLSHYTDQRDWDAFLPYVLFAYRTAPHESTRETPFFLLYGRDARLPFPDIIRSQRINYAVDHDYKAEMMARLHHAFTGVRENLLKAAIQRKEYYDRKAEEPPFRIGDLVLLHTPQIKRGQTYKLARLWKGPYRILEKLGPVNFRIARVGSTTSTLVHANRLKRYYPRDFLYEEVEEEDEEIFREAPLFPKGDNQEDPTITNESLVKVESVAEDEFVSPKEEMSDEEIASAQGENTSEVRDSSDSEGEEEGVSIRALRSRGSVQDLPWVMPTSRRPSRKKVHFSPEVEMRTPQAESGVSSDNLCIEIGQAPSTPKMRDRLQQLVGNFVKARKWRPEHDGKLHSMAS